MIKKYKSENKAASRINWYFGNHKVTYKNQVKILENFVDLKICPQNILYSKVKENHHSCSHLKDPYREELYRGLSEIT